MDISSLCRSYVFYNTGVVRLRGFGPEAASGPLLEARISADELDCICRLWIINQLFLTPTALSIGTKFIDLG